MSKFEKIKNTFSFKNEGKIANSESDKIAILNIFLLLFFLIFGLTAINYEGNFRLSSLILAVVTVLNFTYFYKTQNIKLSASILLFTIYSFLVASLFLGFSQLLSFITVISIPIFALLLFGTKRGAIISLSTLIALFLILYTHPIYSANYIIILNTNPAYSIDYMDTFRKSILFSFFLIFVISYVYFKFQEITFKKLHKKLLDIEHDLNKKNEFIISLSQQIRTPLNNMNGVINFISKSKLTKEQDDLLNTMKASSNNLVSIVNNIGDFSDIKLAYLDSEKSEFNFIEIVNNTLNSCSLDKELQFDINFSDKLPKNIIGQTVKLKQILLNVVEFFIKYYPKEAIPIALGIQINIVREKEDKITISFEFKSKVHLTIDIENFNSQNKKAKNLDYSITHSLIESEKGSMNILSNPFETIFNFTLEFSKAKIEAVNKKEPKENLDLKNTDTKNKKIENLNESVVLIVEDNLINQKIMVLSLKKLVSDIVIANNGQEALDSMKHTHFDIVLMDIQMPVMDGLEASIRIRKDEVKSDTEIPIIAITANALHGDRESCLAAGMNDYISKPFKLEILLEKMKQHLNLPN